MSNYYKFAGHGKNREDALENLSVGVVLAALWNEAQKFEHGSHQRLALSRPVGLIQIDLHWVDSNKPDPATNSPARVYGKVWQADWTDIPILTEMCREVVTDAKRLYYGN